MFHLRLSLPPPHRFTECTSTSLWTSRCARVWFIGPALGELVCGRRKRLPARMDRSRATRNDIVLGHPPVPKTLVVLVLDSDDGCRLVRRLALTDSCRPALQQVRTIATTRSRTRGPAGTCRNPQWRNTAAGKDVL